MKSDWFRLPEYVALALFLIWSTAAMVHVLVKWPGTSLFDVYPLCYVRDSRCERMLSEDVNNVCEFAGKSVPVKWDAKKELASGYILAAGSQRDMEKKRDRYAKAMLIAAEISSLTHEDANKKCTDCENARRKLDVAEMRHREAVEECEKLRATLQESDSRYEMGRMVKKMRKLVDQIQHQVPQAESAAEKVNIGNGVLVERSALARIDAQCSASANRHARVLLCNEFGRENLVGKSLYGVQSNANKGAEVKPALDREKLDAVLGYTCQKFKVPAGNVKNSLASMLTRLSRNNKENVDAP